MAEAAYLISPRDDVAAQIDWEELGRAERITQLHDLLAPLGDDIRARLRDFSLEYMEGVGAWTARTSTPTDRDTLVRALAGLPVVVSEADRFYALES